MRTIERISDGFTTREGGGFLVHRAFPIPGLEMLDPFLLLDEMGPSEYAPGEAKGAPDHPHRGFETVTYLLEGAMEHHDSHGQSGKLRPGSVQWMTAGAGVIHSEMPTREFQQSGGRMHGFQIWVNLPRASKMMTPRYQDLESIAPVTVAPNVSAKLIAGEISGNSGPAQTVSPVTIAHLEFGAGSSAEIPLDPEAMAAVWVFDGTLTSDGKNIAQYRLGIYSSDGDGIRLEANDPAECLLLSGRALREPVARYGPFVMNTRAEIIEAVEDFQEGRFGGIPAEIRKG